MSVQLMLVVGLGNPGLEYAATRHNVGFVCADVLATRAGIQFNQRRARSQVAIGELVGTRVVLAKPLTYMNLCGEAVRRLLQEFGVPLRDMLVVYDDVDLPLGKIRLRGFGSPGTHNGMRNIVQVLGTEQFARLRIGVGQPPEHVDVRDYVLSPFQPAERDMAREAIERAAQAVVSLIERGWTKTMTEYNR